MKKKDKKMSLRDALRTASKSARRKAFKKGLPVAISKNGQIFFVYKNREEKIAPSSTNQ